MKIVKIEVVKSGCEMLREWHSDMLKGIIVEMRRVIIIIIMAIIITIIIKFTEGFLCKATSLLLVHQVPSGCARSRLTMMEIAASLGERTSVRAAGEKLCPSLVPPLHTWGCTDHRVTPLLPSCL